MAAKDFDSRELDRIPRRGRTLIAAEPVFGVSWAGRARLVYLLKTAIFWIFRRCLPAH
jgi:hypothetical protein